MKRKTTFILLSAIVVLFLSLNYSICSLAQEGWSIPAQITEDANFNCRNIDMITTNNNGYNEMWVAYERYSDSASTAICLQEILNNGEPVEILNEDFVHYLNPHFFVSDNFYQGDTLFFLFYETIQNGIRNINYIKYLSSGEILGPYPFFQTIADEQDMDISTFEPQFVWISNGNLFYSTYSSSSYFYGFSEPIVVDSGNCISPKVVGWGNIFYIKHTDSTSGLYHRVNMGGYFCPGNNI